MQLPNRICDVLNMKHTFHNVQRDQYPQLKTKIQTNCSPADKGSTSDMTEFPSGDTSASHLRS